MKDDSILGIDPNTSIQNKLRLLTPKQRMHLNLPDLDLADLHFADPRDH